MKGRHKIEPKYFDAGGALNPVWAGAVTKLSAITQGVSVNSRNGDGVDLIGIELRFAARPSAGQDTHRICVFWVGISDSTAAITAGTFFAGLLTGTLDAPLSAYNWTTMRSEDFAVIHDEVVEVGAGLNDARHIVRPLKGRIQFDPGAVTGTGHLYLAVIGTAVAGTVGLGYYSRLFFTDA